MLNVSHLLFVVACAGLCGGSKSQFTLSDPSIADVRPDDMVRVNMSFQLQHIEEMDEKRGAFRVVFILMLTWNDGRLSPHPGASFSSDDKLRFDASSIWVPDIALYNSATPGLQMLHQVGMKDKVVVANGVVIWAPHLAASVPCWIRSSMNATSCRLTFGSWTYDGGELDLHVPSTDDEVTQEFRDEHPSWELSDLPRQSRVVQHYSCCDTPFVTVNVDIPIKRRGHQ